MHSKRITGLSLVLLSLVVFSGCPANNRPEVETKLDVYPASGKVTLNGSPSKYSILITFNKVKKEGEKNIPPGRTSSLKDGSFKIKLTEGDYKVTFKLPARKAFDMNNDPDSNKIDLFENKYSDPGESEFKVTVKAVEGDAVNDLGEYKLESDVKIDPKKVLPRMAP